MRATQDYELQAGYASTSQDYGTSHGVGWITFAAVLLGLAGIWGFIAGILAVASSHVYSAESVFVFGDLTTWGWIVIVLGLIQGFAALTLLAGNELARWFGIGAAGLSAIGQLMFVPVYPWWAIAMFSVDVLIIYGLAVHGGHGLRRARE